MNRREFLKLLGISIPAITLARPELAETEVTEKPTAVEDKPSYWTATERTLSTTAWSRVWLEGNKVVYYPHPWKAIHKNLVFNRDKNIWNTYTEVR